ncbi:TonB-dependent receptor [Undibacterium sp. CY18W]|uniref:TonB-dependent receptor n=1 Tax=Undibacterium hunanense TaxID=2762292 RepID=A0ABR6ZUW7_9BURK|nr:TonB-dependent receptor [Undibacterium hunanense]MBC3919388.1 TonB-dependent receptor [Undibacterium hunanense]
MRKNLLMTSLISALTVNHAYVNYAYAAAPATPAGTTTNDESGPAQDSDRDKPAQVDTVVVSGDKLKRSEIDSSNSVGIRNGRQMAEAANASLENVVSRMANVGTAQGLSIRGVPLYGPTGGDGKTATITIDGVAQEGYGQDFSGMSVWDADRVEVLRGPQSTNQGRNALAGAVVMRTRDPLDRWDFSSRVSMGNFNTQRVAVAGGGALVQDLAAFRISIEQQRSDGESFNQTRNDSRWNPDDNHTYRGKLRLTPFGDNYQAKLTLVESQQQLGDSYVEMTTRNVNDRIALSNMPHFSSNHTKNLALEQSMAFGKTEVTLLTTLARNRYNRLTDYDKTELNQGTAIGLHIDKQFSQEARANFDLPVFGNQLKGVVGAYYATQKSNASDDFHVPVSYVLNIFGLCPNPTVCEAAYPNDLILRNNGERNQIDNRAVFGELDYSIDKLTLTAGVRYDKEKQSRILISNTSGNTATAKQVVTQMIGAGVVANDGIQDLATDFSAWLPKLGVRYNFSKDWMAGITAQRGYRTGGVNYSYQRGAKAYAPETTSNYEFSVKGKPAEQLFLALNIYRVDWRDQQVNIARNSLDTYIVNAGKSRLQGMELELRGQVHPDLEVFGALGISRSRYLDFTSPQGNFTGNQFERSPDAMQSLGFTWKPGAWIINGDVVHEAGTYSDAANTANRRNDGHTIFNSKLSYAMTEGIRFFAYGSNLLNSTYTTYRTDTVGNRQAAVLGKGRMLGLGVEAKI